jgi:hypothetical protein
LYEFETTYRALEQEICSKWGKNVNILIKSKKKSKKISKLPTQTLACAGMTPKKI